MKRICKVAFPIQKTNEVFLPKEAKILTASIAGNNLVTLFYEEDTCTAHFSNFEVKRSIMLLPVEYMADEGIINNYYNFVCIAQRINWDNFNVSIQNYLVFEREVRNYLTIYPKNLEIYIKVENEDKVIYEREADLSQAVDIIENDLIPFLIKQGEYVIGKYVKYFEFDEEIKNAIVKIMHSDVHVERLF